MAIVESAFFVSLFLSLWALVGYLAVIQSIASIALVCPFRRRRQTKAVEPYVTVYLPARDEEAAIVSRLANLADLDYPAARLEILVISDGSTDRTVALAERFASEHPEANVRCIAVASSQGRAHAQNIAARVAKHPILVTTDAATSFEPDCLRQLMAPFNDPRVGVVGGEVTYLPRDPANAVGLFYGIYRRLEYRLRRAESLLGIGVKTDGPMTAYRKAIWEDLVDFEDVDQVISMVARRKGFLTVHVSGARGYDAANETHKQEVAQRTRMTRKAWLSLFHRWSMADCLRHPLYSFALLSHKYMRFMFPIFAMFAAASGLMLAAFKGHGLALFATLCGGVVIAYSVDSFLTGRRCQRFVAAFLSGNWAYVKGFFQALLGNREGRYLPTQKIR